MTKTKDKYFDPNRFGMKSCPVCKGTGKLLNDLEGEVVCSICGGFGFIKKEGEGRIHK